MSTSSSPSPNTPSSHSRSRDSISLHAAADLLGLPRAVVVRMVERGVIPPTGRQTGMYARVMRADVLALRRWLREEQGTTDEAVGE